MAETGITIRDCLSQIDALSKENKRLRIQHQKVQDDLEMWLDRYAVLRHRADEMFVLLQQAQRIDKGDMSLDVDDWLCEVKQLIGEYYERP